MCVASFPVSTPQLFFARSKISGERAWEISSRELRWLRDVGCVVLLNRITRDVNYCEYMHVAAPTERQQARPLKLDRNRGR